MLAPRDIGNALLLILLAATAALSIGCGSRSTEPPEPAATDLAAALSELAALSAPPGVDPAMFEELKRELASALESLHTSGKIALGAPQGERNEVQDLQLVDIDGQDYLEWSYRSVGDYDQNSEVNGADLAPIALRFLKTASDPDWDSFAHVDGDGNGEVNAADISPIAANFLSRVAHYEIGQFDSAAGDYEVIGQVAFSLATGSPLRFSVPVPAAGLGQLLAVRPSDGGGSFGPWAGLAPPPPLSGLPGPGTDPALDHIPDMPFPDAVDIDLILSMDGFAVSHRRLVVVPSDSATVDQFNAALTAIQGQIIGANSTIALLLLYIEVDDFQDTLDALASLMASGAVAEALFDMGDGEEMLPLHTAQPPDRWFFDLPDYSALYPTQGDKVALGGANYWLPTVRAPQMWNLDTLIKRHRAGNVVHAAVFDGGFDIAHPDLVGIVTLDGTANPAPPPDAFTDSERDHGTLVAAIIGANGGNGQGVIGLNPWIGTVRVRVSPSLLLATPVNMYSTSIDRMFTLLRDHAQVKAINQSEGLSRFYSGNVVSPPAPAINPQAALYGTHNYAGFAPLSVTPNLDGDLVPDTYAAVMAYWGSMYNNRAAQFKAANNGRADFIIVASAGNGGAANLQAVDNSAIANAAVIHGVHFYCVEATNSVNAQASFSNLNGVIAAPGQCVRSAESNDLANFDATVCDGHDSPTDALDLAYATQSGTSFAAPQVAALATVLWRLDAGLTVDEVRQLITAAGNTVATGGANRIDCFAAVTALDALRGNKTIQRALVDVDDGTQDGNLRTDPFTGQVITTVNTTDKRRGDGKVNMSDFRAFRDAWLLAKVESAFDQRFTMETLGLDGGPRHFKKDLNFDGIIYGGISAGQVVSPPHPVDIGLPTQLDNTPQEGAYPRFDFNGDGIIHDWSATAPFRRDPDEGFGTDTASVLREHATHPLRDLDVLLDKAMWSNDYWENASPLAADEGGMLDNGGWLPQRFLLGNRDGYLMGTEAEPLARTPDFLHSCDLHLRIDWDSFDASVTAVFVEVRSEMWPESPGDPPYEKVFDRYRTFPRENGIEDVTVTIPLWTGAMALRWEGITMTEEECHIGSTHEWLNLGFGSDISHSISSVGFTPGWTAFTLDSTGDAGKYTSIAIVEDHPAIAYYGDGHVRYIRANDGLGFSWGPPRTTAEDVAIGVSVNLALIGGMPCIGYSDHQFWDDTLGTINTVNFVSATDATGNAWNAPVYSAQITSGLPQLGWHNDLIELGGKPAQCFLGQDYLGDASTALNFMTASDAAGTTWNAPERAAYDETSPAGYWCSMLQVGGMPAIAYINSRNERLYYIRATSADGSTWTDPLELDFVGSHNFLGGSYPGKHASMAMVGGRPAIAYFWGNDFELGGLLAYIRAEDALGSAWSARQVIHIGEPSTGVYCSLAVIDGKPAVSFHDMARGDLMYIEALDFEGRQWWWAEPVDCVGSVGRYSSLVEVENALPGISYYDASTQSLKYAVRQAQ